MKILVATDAHIYETPDGKHWTPAIYGYSFWKRYLEVFDNVRIVARTKKIKKLSGKELLVDGPGVEIFPLPFFQGPKELIKVYFQIHRSLKNVEDGCDVALFRMPSQTAQMTFQHIRGKLPIGGEIVYDPTEDLNRNDVNVFIHFLNKVISNRLKVFCKNANGVSYVTENSIQNHYPSYARLYGSSKKHFETYYSTITLSDKAFDGAKKYEQKENLVLALSDVAMNTERKGERTLIETVKLARDRDYDVSAIIIGDGSMRKTFEEYAKSLGVIEYVSFTGLLPSSNAVKDVLKKADIFVFPTRGEGLPRGILEAMALGMPVLSTPVGGIPEVIENKYLFDPKDSHGYADMICHLMTHRNEMNEISKRNYQKSLEFHNDKLQKRRNEFYTKLKDLVGEI